MPSRSRAGWSWSQAMSSMIDEIVARASTLRDRTLFEQLGARVLPEEEIAAVAWKEGTWPGVTRGPNVPGRGDETASASREPWVDANGYRIGWLKALYPNKPAVLGYTPD